MRPGLVFALLLSAALVATAPAQELNPFLEKYTSLAARQRDDGDLPAALASVQRALERDARSLNALALQAELAKAVDDLDLAVHSLHQWTDIVAAAKRSPVNGKTKREFATEIAATLATSAARSSDKVSLLFRQ